MLIMKAFVILALAAVAYAHPQYGYNGGHGGSSATASSAATAGGQRCGNGLISNRYGAGAAGSNAASGAAGAGGPGYGIGVVNSGYGARAPWPPGVYYGNGVGAGRAPGSSTSSAHASQGYPVATGAGYGAANQGSALSQYRGSNHASVGAWNGAGAEGINFSAAQRSSGGLESSGFGAVGTTNAVVATTMDKSSVREIPTKNHTETVVPTTAPTPPSMVGPVVPKALKELPSMPLKVYLDHTVPTTEHNQLAWLLPTNLASATVSSTAKMALVPDPNPLPLKEPLLVELVDTFVNRFMHIMKYPRLEC